MSSKKSDLYFMSPPGIDWQLRGRANFRSREAAPVDARTARREWLALAEAIERTGATVVVQSPVSGLTGMPYAAECGHVVGDRFLLPRMAAPHRKEEAPHWAKLAESIGLRPTDIGGGTWEAQGDVALFDGATILFYGGRTDREGFERARSFFTGETFALEIREPAFHGNMALLPLPAIDRMLVCPDVVANDGVLRLEERFGKERILRVTEDEIKSYATNGLPIGNTLLAPSLVPARVRDLVSSLGMTVELLAMDELCGKAGGASRCLVCHVPNPPSGLTIGDEHRLARFASEIRA
jgi:N-dimethylarginine dimethylaminohydrolase